MNGLYPEVIKVHTETQKSNKKQQIFCLIDLYL